MTEENIEQPISTQESTPEPVAATEVATDKPAPKKRGRKPKSALAPAPTPVEVPKPRKRRNVVRLSRDERAFSAAVATTEKERAKCIDELSKIMEMWDVKQARLKALDWKISTLKGTSDKSAIAGMRLQEYSNPSAPGPGYPIPPQYPQPPAYPYPSAPAYMPPGMRTPVPPGATGAGGGAEGVVDDDNDDPDKFLKVGGVVGGGGFV